MRAPYHRVLAPRRQDLGRTHILASSTLEPRVRQIELEGENIFPVCDVLLFRINTKQMKKAHKRKKDLPQREKLPMRSAAPRSEQLLAQILTDDFCEFGSSEVIGVFVQQNFSS